MKKKTVFSVDTRVGCDDSIFCRYHLFDETQNCKEQEANFVMIVTRHVNCSLRSTVGIYSKEAVELATHFGNSLKLGLRQVTLIHNA